MKSKHTHIQNKFGVDTLILPKGIASQINRYEDLRKLTDDVLRSKNILEDSSIDDDAKEITSGIDEMLNALNSAKVQQPPAEPPAPPLIPATKPIIEEVAEKEDEPLDTLLTEQPKKKGLLNREPKPKKEKPVKQPKQPKEKGGLLTKDKPPAPPKEKKPLFGKKKGMLDKAKEVLEEEAGEASLPNLYEKRSFIYDNVHEEKTSEISEDDDIVKTLDPSYNSKPKYKYEVKKEGFIKNIRFGGKQDE